MADALSLGATYSSVRGSARPLPMERARPPHYWPRSSVVSSCSAAFALPFAQWGSAKPTIPHSPSVRLSKHQPSVKKSSIWARKKSSIWGMCSGPPRYYNLFNRQAGRPLNLPPPRVARLFTCFWRRSWAVWTGALSVADELRHDGLLGSSPCPAREARQYALVINTAFE
jgi:hypothetical protein